jgi:SAM-dependent methyltransferase
MTPISGSAILDGAPNLSHRVENYLQYRPRYPPAILELIKSECSLLPDHVIADIGSGTGLLAQLFLDHGNRVYGVEPDADMRLGAKKALQGRPDFISVDGTAEATGLPDASVDFISAGQAFHWFDRRGSKTEFQRVLRPAGWVLLAWNMQWTGGTPFLDALQSLWTYPRCWRDPPGQPHARLAKVQEWRTSWDAVRRELLDPFFGMGEYREARFENPICHDFASLKGRLLSNATARDPGDPGYCAMLETLQTIFDTHQDKGTVTIEHDTRVVYGRLG